MSHTNYAFNLRTDLRPREQLKLRNAASAQYGGDWLSIPHSHNYTELFYIVGGDGQFQISDQAFPVRANQLIVVNPNIVHTELSYQSRPLRYIVIGIEGLEITISGTGEGRYCVYSLDEGNDVLSCMRKILEEMHEQKAGFETVCQAYMDIIITKLMRKADVSLTQVPSRFSGNRQCASIKHYIDHHFKENISLDQLAEMAGINKCYLGHAFKREYGISPINHLIACRIRESKRLLAETDLTLRQIASIVGFSSSSYFSQAFRKSEGSSPIDYRKANQNTL